MYFPSWHQNLFLYQCTSLHDVNSCFSISVLPFMTSAAVSLSVSFPSWRQQLFLYQYPSLHDVNSCFCWSVSFPLWRQQLFRCSFGVALSNSPVLLASLVSHCPTHLYCSPLWCRIVQLTCIARLFGVALSSSPVLLASPLSRWVRKLVLPSPEVWHQDQGRGKPSDKLWQS